MYEPAGENTCHWTNRIQYMTIKRKLHGGMVECNCNMAWNKSILWPMLRYSWIYWLSWHEKNRSLFWLSNVVILSGPSILKNFGSNTLWTNIEYCVTECSPCSGRSTYVTQHAIGWWMMWHGVLLDWVVDLGRPTPGGWPVFCLSDDICKWEVVICT